MMQQQPMMSPQGRPPQGRPPQGRPPQGAPRQGIAQLNPNVPMQTQLNQFSKLPPQQLEARKNESFLTAIAAEQQAAKAEAAQREKLMSENPKLATDEKIIDRLRQSTIASMMPPTNPMPNVMDKAGGVAGVLQNKAANRKRSMNKLASAGLPATGKPPIQNMAGGGILGYQTGGYVPSEEEIAAYLRENPAIAKYDNAKDKAITALTKRFNQKSSGLNRRRIAGGITDEQIDKVLADNKYMGDDRAKAKEALIDREERKRKRIDPSLRDMAAAAVKDEDLKIPSGSSIPRAGEEDASLAIAELERQEEIQKIIDKGGSSSGDKSLAAAVEEAQKAATNPIPITPAPLTGPAAGPAGATAGPAGSAGANAQLSRQEQIDQAIGAMGTKDYTENVGEKQVTEALGQPYINTLTGMQEADPEAKKLAEEQRLDARFNPDDRIGKLGRKQQERYEGILNAQQDPARMQKLKRIAMGIGAAGQTDMGGIAAGIGAANLNFERQKDLSQLAGSRGLASLEDTDITRKTNVLEKSTTGASTLGESIRADRRSGMTTGANIAEADLTAARTDVKNAFDRDVQIAGISAKQYANKLSADMNMLIKEANSVQALAQVQNQLNKAVETAEKAINDKFNQSRINSIKARLNNEARERLNNGEPPESYEEEFLQEAMLYRKALEERLGIARLRNSIAEKRNAISGGGSSGTAILNPAQQAALNAI